MLGHIRSQHLAKLQIFTCWSLSAPTEEDFEYMSRVPYSSVVGSLMYAMVCSRPDLSYAMSLVSRYMANLGKKTLEGCSVDF